jgi:ABC-2 type transport system permease protein
MKPRICRTCRLRLFLTGRKMRYGSNAVVLTIAVVAIVLMVNSIAGRYSVKFDLTRTGFYTLSDATIEVLRGLSQPVKITAFFQEGDALGEVVRDLLREYTRISSKVSVEFVDPDKMPSLAKQYDISAYGTSVVEAGLKSRKVMEYELIDYQTPTDMVNFSGEQAFTRALIGLFTGSEHHVLFTAGHDERDPMEDYWQTRSFLDGEGYIIRTVNLATTGRVPSEADVLVIAGPRKDFTKEEINAVRLYLEGGGNVIALLDPQGQAGGLTNLKELLKTRCIGINDDLVIDPGSHYFLDMAGVIPMMRDHSITEKLIAKGLSTFLPRSRSLYLEKGPEISGITVEPLLETTEQAWGETDSDNNFEFDPKSDIKGPLTLAYISSEDSGARLIAVGNASFLDNDIVTFQGIIDFFMNSVGWMVGKGESISIRPKSPGFEGQL